MKVLVFCAKRNHQIGKKPRSRTIQVNEYGHIAFSALTSLVRWKEDHLVCKK